MLKIGMSDSGDKNTNYRSFLLKLQDAEVVILGKDSHEAAGDCDALVLTGGEDVSPELYGDWPDETVHINPERDGVEFRLIEVALKKEIPILGICRGLQVVNVYFGGTLVLDLERYHGRNHKAISEKEDRYHGVTLFGASHLQEFIRQESGEVNSSHHQAADRIGSGLKVAARAEDGTVEAIEGNDDLPSRIVSVQWHPERMRFESPFARGVLDLFGSCLSNNHNKEKYAHGG
jgi:putative glutamine amidotransferase